MPAFTLVVNGRPVVSVPDQAAAEQAIRELLQEYQAGVLQHAARVERLEIAESVGFRPDEVAEELLRDKEQAKSILKRGTDKLAYYSVQRGDSLWSVAEARGITVENLQQANPDVVPEALQIGHQLSLIVPEPYVHITSVETQAWQEALAFPEEVGQDPDLWPWQYRVTEPGSNGSKRVTVRIHRQDGKEVKRETIQEEILARPKLQRSVRGTKLAPNRGTGSLNWPLTSGELTSRYGYRWGGFHTGVDVAAPTGTAVMAADSGTVTYAGWQGGYGYLVEIDHGAGKQITRYGHLSLIGVKLGQTVEKGDTIGAVGSTGWSTGPHLHYEVLQDGRSTDPLAHYN